MPTRKLRVANLKYLITLPFRQVSELEFVEYQENSSGDNVRKLHRGELDLALIPVTEYAAHGGYEAIGFGVGFYRRAHVWQLCARQSIAQLKSVFVYDGAVSSGMLLRLLLIHLWEVTPRIIRIPEKVYPGELKPTEGTLVFDETPFSRKGNYPVVEDLVTAWYKLTQKPIVPLIWVARPGALTRDYGPEFIDFLHKLDRARESVAGSYANDVGLPENLFASYISNIFSYYIDSDMIVGLNEYFARCAAYGLLPKAVYRETSARLAVPRGSGGPKPIGVRNWSHSAKFPRAPNLQSSSSVEVLVPRPIQVVFDGILEGHQLNVVDALKLATSAPLTALARIVALVSERKGYGIGSMTQRTGLIRPGADPGSSNIERVFAIPLDKSGAMEQHFVELHHLRMNQDEALTYIKVRIVEPEDLDPVAQENFFKVFLVTVLFLDSIDVVLAPKVLSRLFEILEAFGFSNLAAHFRPLSGQVIGLG